MEKEDGVNIIGAWTLGKNREFSGRFLFCMEFPSPQLLSKLSRNLHVWVTVLLVLQFFFSSALSLKIDSPGKKPDL